MNVRGTETKVMDKKMGDEMDEKIEFGTSSSCQNKSSESDSAEISHEEVGFKAPSLPPLQQVNKKAEPTEFVSEQKKPEPSSEFSSVVSTDTASLSSVLSRPVEQPASTEPLPPLPYTVPVWSEVPSQTVHYSLDVMKSGMELGNKPLNEGKSFYVIGRLANCDIQLEHPSISRYHAVLQYGNYGISDGKSSKTGWHLFDLGSTHGSWWNKLQIPPKQFIRLHVGHVLKFGGSTRIFILQGPKEDEEKESSRTVTQLKEEAEKKKLIAQGILDDPDVKKSDTETEETDDSPKDTQPGTGGINWGIGDDDIEVDANEEGEEDGEDIDFESLQQREEYYRDDPKKVLRRWFERNEFEFSYQFSEKGIGFKHQWVCTIELPLDTPSGKALTAEVVVSGSKREAQVQCALEACRVLDANGVLRSQSESKRRKLKTLADNDYYDSDEDNFFDRTGELDRKREMRRRRSVEGTVAAKRAETYESLCAKLDETRKEMREIQKELDELVDSEHTESKRRKSGDALDDYMSKLKDVTPGTDDAQEVKIQKSKLRLKLVELKEQANHWERLAKIAKPISLPQLKKPELRKTEGTGMGEEEESGKKGPMIWIGSMKGHRLRRVAAPIAPPVASEQSAEKTETKPEMEVEEEEEEEPKDKKEPGIKEVHSPDPDHSDTATSERGLAEKIESASSSAEKVYSVELPPKNLVEESIVDTKLEEPATKKRRRVQKRTVEEKPAEDYDANDPDYAVWLPPEDQSGDGTTVLNAKFGY